jgi:hypothetical protein
MLVRDTAPLYLLLLREISLDTPYFTLVLIIWVCLAHELTVVLPILMLLELLDDLQLSSSKIVSIALLWRSEGAGMQVFHSGLVGRSKIYKNELE